jgi:hypothetical protein
MDDAHLQSFGGVRLGCELGDCGYVRASSDACATMTPSPRRYL